MSNKYKYIGDALHLRGSTGTAWAAEGHDDPESAEYRTYLYAPDNNEHEEAFYVDGSRDIQRI
jgi:hypothetical protein